MLKWIRRDLNVRRSLRYCRFWSEGEREFSSPCRAQSRSGRTTKSLYQSEWFDTADFWSKGLRVFNTLRAAGQRTLWYTCRFYVVSELPTIRSGLRLSLPTTPFLVMESFRSVASLERI